jgi:hypothetical protein
MYRPTTKEIVEQFEDLRKEYGFSDRTALELMKVEAMYSQSVDLEMWSHHLNMALKNVFEKAVIHHTSE